MQTRIIGVLSPCIKFVTRRRQVSTLRERRLYIGPDVVWATWTQKIPWPWHKRNPSHSSSSYSISICTYFLFTALSV